MKGALGVIAVVLATVAGQSLASGRSHAVRYLMGTWCDLLIFDPPSDDGAAEAAFRQIGRVESVLSGFDSESEVSRLNAASGRGPRLVSAELATVAGEAKELCSATGGAFDPSIAPLLAAWSFDTETPREPSPERLREAASRVGCDLFDLRTEPPSIALAKGAALDFGGMGKGYAVDRALEVLRSRGVTRAKLDFGSSSLGFIGRVDGGWPVVIADPRNREEPLLSFRVMEGAVSSSGQRERSFFEGGRRYGHIFDPRSGVPAESQLLVVTVVAPLGSTADALSTALFVLGAHEGARLVSRMPGVSAVFAEERPGGGLAITTAGPVDHLERLSR